MTVLELKVISSSNAQGLRDTYMGDIISWMFYYTALASELSATSSPLTNSIVPRKDV